jgi:adenine phosphoribosyltransferase
MVNDHPDVAGVLRDPELLALVGVTLAAPYVAADVSVVCAPEARGPVIGALVARELGAGLVLARKHDRNHPGADLTVTSEPTWRGAPERFQLRSFDFRPGDRVLVVDDWITTGSSIAAVRDVVTGCGALYLGASVLVNKAEPATLDALDVAWAVSFDDLGPPS